MREKTMETESDAAPGVDTFDSRALRYTDTFGQRFMKEGTYRYSVVQAGCGGLTDDPPFTVEVADGKDDSFHQHMVTVRYADGGFTAEPERLQVESGDLVTWAIRQPGAPVFEVVGEKEFFHSGRMVNESGFAHAFASPGRYEWADAYGSGLGGVVDVRDPDCNSEDDLARWRKSLADGVLVMVAGETADPARVEVTVGQTVYFAIAKTDGVSVTDTRLLDVEHLGNPHKRRRHTKADSASS